MQHQRARRARRSCASYRPGVTEWMTHPGYPDPESGSEYDMARREDLDEILRARVRERFDKPVWGEDVIRSHPRGGVRLRGRALEDASSTEHRCRPRTESGLGLGVAVGLGASSRRRGR